MATGGRRLNLDFDKLVKLYEQGVSVKAMAEQFGCSRNVVVRRMEELGLVVRGRSEAMLIRQADMTREQRLALLEKAHAAARGRVHTEEECVLRAHTRFRKQLGSSLYQFDVQRELAALGVETLLEFPVGKYNLDIACCADSIGVELHGGNWHGYGRHQARRKDRLEYILGQGWGLIEIWRVGTPGWSVKAVAQQVLAITQGIGPDPADGCKHWMLGCDGEPARVLRSEGYEVAAVRDADRRDQSTGRYGRVSGDTTRM